MLSFIFQVVVGLASLEKVAGRAPFPGRVLTRSSDTLEKYDYVIVGGGLSGMVVANRLSEDPKTSVLVIEAGGFDQQEDFVTIPLITSSNIPSVGVGAPGTKYDWNLTGIPQPALKNRSIATPAGKVIGGGTILNGMVYNRGSKSDYDRWEQLGNPGWNFDGLLPYFKKAETFTPPGAELSEWDIEYDPAFHGNHGFLQSSFSRFVWPSTRNYINAMQQLDVPILKDAAGGNAAGSYWFPLSLNPNNETRCSARSFYIPQRQNLHLLINNQVTKLLFSSGKSRPKVIGVEYSTGKDQAFRAVTALREVVLSAGALHTPQLLQISGIGDGNHLSTLGIKSVVDLPGVGANYQDHLLLFTGQTVDISINTGNFSNATWKAEMLKLYDEKREGQRANFMSIPNSFASRPYTTVGGNFFAFLPLPTFSNNTSTISSQAAAQSPGQYLPANTHPSIIAGYAAQHTLLTQNLPSSSTADVEFIFGDGTILPALQLPFSRGRVLINSTSAFDSPVIDPRYLSNPLDLASLVEGFKYARIIRETNAMQEIKVEEVYPGPSVQTDDAIEDFVAGGVSTENHHSGTASMLPKDLGGVVDASLTVYGVQGLRIVDASVVPMLPAAHLQATMYAIAEKAADLIIHS